MSMGKPGGGTGGGGGGGTLPPSTILIRLKNINNIRAIFFIELERNSIVNV